MSDTPKDENPYRGYHAQLLNACVEYRAKVDKLEEENAALREQLINVTSELTVTKVNASADKERLEGENAALRAEVDQWASRCAAAIWMLPETVTGGELRAAQDKFHRERENLRRENAALRNKLAMYEGQTRFLCQCGGTKP
jgi:FtsZ-binding cell division protein ZapB